MVGFYVCQVKFLHDIVGEIASVTFVFVTFLFVLVFAGYGIAAHGVKHLVRTLDCVKLTITLIARHVFDHNQTFSDILTWCLFFFSTENAMKFEEFWNVLSWLTIDDRKQFYDNAVEAHFSKDDKMQRTNDSSTVTQLWYDGLLNIIDKYRDTCLSNIDASNKWHHDVKCELLDCKFDDLNLTNDNKYMFGPSNDDFNNDNEVDEFDTDKTLVFDV